MNINESLLEAARNGDANAVKALLDAGADVNARIGENDDHLSLRVGFTALMIAAEFGHMDIVSLLLNKGADVNAQSNHGQTALMVAASSGHTDIVKMLLDAVRADEELTMDNIRAWDVNENVKKPLLDLRVEEDRKEARRAYVNVQDTYGRTALMYAAWKGHLDIVNVLIDAGADVNAKDKEFGRTVLMFATYSGNTDTVNVLINALRAAGVLSVTVNAQDNRGNTALSLAEQEGHTAIADMLRNAGAR